MICNTAPPGVTIRAIDRSRAMIEQAARRNRLRRLLARGGAFYLFEQHPSAHRTRAVTRELTTAVKRNGLGVRELTTAGAGAATMTCIVAGLRA